jgi:hypothetical protein
MLAKKTSKNQLTLPKDIVKEFPETEYFDVTVQDRKIILLPVRIMPVDTTLEETRKKTAETGVTEKDVTDAIQWARIKKKIVGRIIGRRNKMKAVSGDVADWIKEGRRERDSRYGA